MNRFLALQELYEDGSTDLEAKWERAKQKWASTCQEAAGRKTTQRKEGITPATLQISMNKDRQAVLNDSRTRAAKAAAQKECNEAHREVERNIRADKRGDHDNQAREAKEPASQINLKDLYDINRKLAGRYQQTDKLAKDK